MASLVAPCTCGEHRRVYASWMREQSLWEEMMSLLRVMRSMLAAAAICPGCGRTWWILGLNSMRLPISTSRLMDAAMSVSRESRMAS